MKPVDRCVAIVDDDELFRRSLERLVRSAGFRVTSFDSAEDMLARGDLDDTACAVLDMKLPGLDGLELQQRLLERAAWIAVVFVSAHDDDRTQAKALRAGAVAFFKKPFDDAVLLDVIERLIRERQKSGGHDGGHE